MRVAEWMIGLFGSKWRGVDGEGKVVGVGDRLRASVSTVRKEGCCCFGEVNDGEWGKEGFHRERWEPPLSQGVATSRNKRSKCLPYNFTFMVAFPSSDLSSMPGRERGESRVQVFLHT